MFQHPISISNKPNGNLWPKDSNWTCLTLKCLWRVCFWPGDFRLIYGFSKEKEFMFLDRESLDRVSNSKAPFVFVLDFSMAENQRPEVTANAAETEGPTPAPDREAVPSDYSSNVRVWSLTSGLELESLPWWSWRSTGAYVHLHYDTFMEWALCSVAILTDFLAIDESGKRLYPGLRHPPTRGWTNPSYLVNGWDVCRETLWYNGQLLVQTYLRNIPMSSWRGTERSGGFFVLKRSFTVSLSLLDVLFGSGWCCGFVCFGFVSVSGLCLDI